MPEPSSHSLRDIVWPSVILGTAAALIIAQAIYFAMTAGNSGAALVWRTIGLYAGLSAIFLGLRAYASHQLAAALCAGALALVPAAVFSFTFAATWLIGPWDVMDRGLKPFLLLIAFSVLGFAASFVKGVWCGSRPSLKWICRGCGLAFWMAFPVMAKVGIDPAPASVLGAVAALPGFLCIFRVLPAVKSIWIWIALPTLMYSLFWCALLPLRVTTFPFSEVLAVPG